MGMDDLDRTIHEPARLRILTVLSGVDEADFNFLLNTLGLTKGNLSSHIDRLEKAGYVNVVKSFNGHEALEKYWSELDAIRNMREVHEE